MSCLQSKELAVEIAAFLLAGINLSGKIFSLSFPFRDDLVGKNDKYYKTKSIILSQVVPNSLKF
jgi:hypothetical protein